MAQDFKSLDTLDMREIEQQARFLRAQAVNDMFKAMGAFFARVLHIGATKTKTSAA